MGAVANLLVGHAGSNKQRDKSKIPNDIQFLYEAIRFYHVAKTVELNEGMMLLPKDDYVYLKQKAEAIVDRFLESESPPKLQVNISQGLADTATKIVRQSARPINPFYEAEMHLLFPTLVIWNKYLTKRWTMGSLANLSHDVRKHSFRRSAGHGASTAAVSAVPSALPSADRRDTVKTNITPESSSTAYFDEVQYEYVLMNATGDLEWTKIFFSIETGIKQYVVVSGIAGHASSEHAAKAGSQQQQQQHLSSQSVHSHSRTPSRMLLSSSSGSGAVSGNGRRRSSAQSSAMRGERQHSVSAAGNSPAGYHRGAEVQALLTGVWTGAIPEEDDITRSEDSDVS